MTMISTFPVVLPPVLAPSAPVHTPRPDVTVPAPVPALRSDAQYQHALADVAWLAAPLAGWLWDRGVQDTGLRGLDDPHAVIAFVVRTVDDGRQSALLVVNRALAVLAEACARCGAPSAPGEWRWIRARVLDAV